MRQNTFKNTILISIMAFLFIQTVALRQLQSSQQIQIEQSKQNSPYGQAQNPFQPNLVPKRHHSGDVKKAKKVGDQQNGEKQIYKPFPTKDQDQQEDQKDNFAQMLFWGMTIGSVFLAVILCKSCMLKRGRCDRRKQLGQQNHQNVVCNNNPYNHHYGQKNMNPTIRVPVQMRPYEQVEHTVSNTVEIDNKIQKYEAQLNSLKQLKEKALRQQLIHKNLEREIPMERVNPHHQNYGPKYYGDKPLGRRQYLQGTDYSLSSNQPFQVQGIDPILPRRRVNSINTEVMESEKNGVYYRNGIPIGKPLNQQDNDSSFASQYPQI